MAHSIGQREGMFTRPIGNKILVQAVQGLDTCRMGRTLRNLGGKGAVRERLKLKMAGN